MKATEDNIPKLAAPGAGLPFIELLVARLIFHSGRRRATRESSTENFLREKTAVLEIVRRCDEKQGAERVLIKRLPGLEDSSRYWSVFMTLDHLRIVNDAVAGVIDALCSGEIPARAASTAEVKPGTDVDRSIIADFEISCRRLEETVAKTITFPATPRYAHPWFGPMDAAAWHFLSGFHLRLHRKQIEAILPGLKADDSR
jgi:hypothetical protein